MSSVAIVTDSNSGITQEEAKTLGLFVLPMPFFINEQLYLEGVNLSHEDFYELLEQGAEVSTSMPAVADVTEFWDNLLKDYEEIVYIPMSSGLSSSCETAFMLAQDYDGKVQVVNNQRISVTQRQSAIDAVTLAKEGKSAAQIREILESVKFESSIYIVVDTLKYLRKGGRLTPAVAALGTLLRIKPVLQIQGEKLDTFAKARTMKQAKQIMIEAMQEDCRHRFDDPKASGETIWLSGAFTKNDTQAMEFMEEIKEIFPKSCDVVMHPLPLSIACHIGPGALAIASSRKLPQ